MLQILLFLHIVAAVMLFAGIGLELAGYARLHRATTVGEVRAATLNFPLVGPLMGIGSLLLIGAGIAMVYVGGFGWSPSWVNVTFAITLVLTINGPLTNGRRSDAIHRMAEEAPAGPITADIQRARSDWFLNLSLNVSLFELIAALFIMTVKPGLIGCVAAVVIALAAGSISAMLVLRRHTRSGSGSAIAENA